MNVNVKEIFGNWDQGFALHKHSLSSTYIGDNEHGRAMFDTTRSEVGEALYNLKYKHDWNQALPLARQIAESILPRLHRVQVLVPMPASNTRPRQPVNEIVQELSNTTGIPFHPNMILKSPAVTGNAQLKNLNRKEEKAAALAGRFVLNDTLTGNERQNALIVDDLFHTGASMEAACAILRTNPKIGNVYVAALTWR